MVFGSLLLFVPAREGRLSIYLDRFRYIFSISSGATFELWIPSTYMQSASELARI